MNLTKIIYVNWLGKAHRMCGSNGMWSTVRNSTQVWSDYSGCAYPQEEEVFKLLKDGDVRRFNIR